MDLVSSQVVQGSPFMFWSFHCSLAVFFLPVVLSTMAEPESMTALNLLPRAVGHPSRAFLN